VDVFSFLVNGVLSNNVMFWIGFNLSSLHRVQVHRQRNVFSAFNPSLVIKELRAARWCNGGALSPHCKRAVGSIPGQVGPSVWSLHVLLVSAWVPSVFSGFLPQSKDMQQVN